MNTGPFHTTFVLCTQIACLCAFKVVGAPQTAPQIVRDKECVAPHARPSANQYGALK